jgi:glutamate-1-semialdehyde 2,1-aminomutase
MTSVSPTSVIRDALNNRADVALSALEARTCHSWKMGLDRAGTLPRNEDFAGHPSFQLYIHEGSGGHVADLDGNRFIDLGMGFGAQLLGHCVPAVQDAVMAQAARGWHFGMVDERQLALARHIQAAAASNERVVLCNSGGEATAYAMRAARAFTGRDLVGVFAGSSHGDHDYGLAGEETRRFAAPGLKEDNGALFARPCSRRAQRHPGVPEAVMDASICMTYGHASAFDHIRRRRHDLAAVIVEPVRALDPSLDHGPWLRELADVCGETGVSLIFDERRTGFRLAYGGAQEHFGVIADLVAYGEVIGGGLPLGALTGRADIIANLTGREPRVASLAERGPAGNMLSVAAGVATLDHLALRRSTLYPALEEKGRLLADTFNGFADAKGLPVRLRRAGSIFRIQFKRPDSADTGHRYGAAEAAFYALALNKGVLVHASRLGFLSAAHTASDIMLAASAFESALTDVASDGLFELKA